LTVQVPDLVLFKWVTKRQGYGLGSGSILLRISEAFIHQLLDIYFSVLSDLLHKTCERPSYFSTWYFGYLHILYEDHPHSRPRRLLSNDRDIRILIDDLYIILGDISPGPRFFAWYSHLFTPYKGLRTKGLFDLLGVLKVSLLLNARIHYGRVFTISYIVHHRYLLPTKERDIPPE
jgi:hypothetical protein